jgi:hypothetical protein
MATEVIEISSDEDEDLLPKRRPVAPPKSNATDLRKDAQRLKEVPSIPLMQLCPMFNIADVTTG